MGDYLHRLDAWLERGEGGSVPAQVLRERGFEALHSAEIDDATLPIKLMELVSALAAIGIYFVWTDHLSDRELYDRIVAEVLPAEMFLAPDDPCIGEHVDMSADATNEIFLTYYADDEERESWREEVGQPLPQRKAKPFNRDRFLPSMASKAEGGGRKAEG